MRIQEEEQVNKLYRYIGNKTRVLDQLIPILTDGLSPGARVADLMCGTAAVSESLRLAGMKVFAADIMTYATYHATVRLTIPEAPRFETLGIPYREVVEHLNALSPDESGYFVREYAPGGSPAMGQKPRAYLSDSNAAKLSAISDEISKWKSSHKITATENQLLRHDLVLAVNRIANISGTYGHHRSILSGGALKDLKLSQSIFSLGNSEGHQVRLGKAEDLAHEITADLVYLDPPYKKRQYAANYHLLETVAVGDKPETHGVSGLRDWWPQYSDFCSKLKIHDALAAIVNGVEAPRIMMSYSEDGLISQQDMVESLSRFGEVKLHEFPHVRFRSNASALERDLKEFVFEVVR
ncbi:hypothetical protein CIK58_17145 [Brevibacterium aurantiacum]|uniref:DNA adenine methylase n=1 Tax=Brevibacterium aurantiacum TaxID=273384 RepID=UPI000BB866F8|nr:DNA adenine methylase [Brevibacterium aurantiacum]PCC55791.1 hypothetical protein CIK58_17145 [Brevibacterium aurantiacum]